MKYKRLMKSVFDKTSNNDAHVAIALITGLAVGAALGVLFAPESGKDVRNGINDKVGGLGQNARNIFNSLRKRFGAHHEQDTPVAKNEYPHFNHTGAKRPKSDIRELIHEAHAGDVHTEQGLS